MIFTGAVVFSSPETLQEAIVKLEEALQVDTFEFQVRREFVLNDLLRAVKKKSYHPLKRVKTWFVGEEGRDTGGLTREMWRLFGKELQGLCEGREGCLLIKHNAEKLQVITLSFVCITLKLIFNSFHSKACFAV